MVDERDDGGPANPTKRAEQDGWTEEGMTLRQAYAKAAMQGLLSRPQRTLDTGEDESRLARAAFSLADYMLAHERREREGAE